MPKHVVDLYVINYIYLYHHIVVLDKYTHSNLFYYKHNGDDEPYERVVNSEMCHPRYVFKLYGEVSSEE